jgi:hypothetical protein
LPFITEPPDWALHGIVAAMWKKRMPGSRSVVSRFSSAERRCPDSEAR